MDSYNFIIMLIHVDDMIVIGSGIDIIVAFKLIYMESLTSQIWELLTKCLGCKYLEIVKYKRLDNLEGYDIILVSFHYTKCQIS